MDACSKPTVPSLRTDDRGELEASTGTRRLQREDLAEVSSLFRKTFNRERLASDSALDVYLERLFVDPLHDTPELGSLVHRKETGEIDGFIGVIAMPFVIDGIERHAAICCALMAENPAGNALAGARLLRGFLSGPQDVSLTETANAVSKEMWRKLRGAVLPVYSLDWVRVFRPAAFAHALATSRWPALRPLHLLARPFDAIAHRAMAAPVRSSCTEDEITDDEAFAMLLAQFTAHLSARPAWDRIDLVRMAVDARRKSRFGAATFRVVRRMGSPIGLYVRHARPGRIGLVLQIAAAPGRMQDVVDRLLASAYDEGLAGVRGRCQPAILEALLMRNCLYGNRASTLVHARNPALIEPFLTGRAFMNGFAGESWTRLIGDDLSG